MILLWLDINSSFAHASLALPALHAQYASTSEVWKWHRVSGNQHTPLAHFIQAAVDIKPDLIASTAWLFNHPTLLEVISRIKALLPNVYVLLGGPEFLGDNENYLRAHPYVNALLRGEGEEVFNQWLSNWAKPKVRDSLPGICTLDPSGVYCDNGEAKVSHFIDLSPPETSRFFHLDKPFVQIETARGCNNDCYFCISGGNKPIRTLPVEQIKARLQKLSERGVHEVRVIDRTFNANPKRTKAMLEVFRGFAGTIRFHVEVDPSLLTVDILDILQDLPDGLLHIEAGIQSLDDQVLKASGRLGSSARALEGIRLLNAIHRFEIHTDLIAGLPFTTLSRIIEDVRELVLLGVDEIQLEILKLLPGTKMREKAAMMGIVHAPLPPYEALSTPSMPPEALWEALQLSRLLDGWFNQKSDWRAPFIQLTLLEDCFLDTFLQHLIHHQLLESPLSMERRGLILYDFCSTHYPSYLSSISVAWIKAGYSLKKRAAGQVVPYKNLKNPKPDVRYYHLPTPSGGLWFGFDRNLERRKPFVVWDYPPE